MEACPELMMRGGQPRVLYRKTNNMGASGWPGDFRPNDQDKLPGRLQRRCVSKSRDAGPVNFIVWFGDY